MIVGRVKGHVVATVKISSLEGAKLLLVEPLDHTGQGDGSEILCVDAAGAGVGEVVLVLQEGGSNRMILGLKDAPIEALIVGIVDFIDL